MASARSQAKVALMDEIIRLGDSAYTPGGADSERTHEITTFKTFLHNTKTLALMPALSTLVQPDRVQPWLRPHLFQALALLPLRPRGVRDTIEFVLSIHPTTINHEPASAAAAESRGPIISLEALNSASKLISAPPKILTPETWFPAIAPQLLELLDGQGGLEMVKAAAYIIGYGILGRREFGAPGAPGWKAFAEPILQKLNPTSAASPLRLTSPSVTTVRPHNLIASSGEVAEALRRLASLLSSHPNPGLSKRLLSPLLQPLWCVSSWPATDGPLEDWRAPAQYLLQIFLQLADGSKVMLIADNILYSGNLDPSRICWSFQLSPEGGLQILKTAAASPQIMSPNELVILNGKVESLIDLLKPSKEIDGVPELFISLCRQWMASPQKPKQSSILLLSEPESDVLAINTHIVKATILQRMIDELPDRLVGQSEQVLELANEILHNAAVSADGEEGNDAVPVALSLVSMVLTSPNFSFSNDTLKASLESALRTLSRSDSEDSATCRNLLMLLEIHGQQTSEELISQPLPDRLVEDKRTHALALSYLTATDSPPPVRAQGLDILSTLITTQSPVVDIPATLTLFASLLQDPEEYIHLRTIRALTSLSNNHPGAVLNDLIDRYFDRSELLTLDARLRLGEALLQTIERAGQTFAGPIAVHVGQALVALSSRRPERRETAAREAKSFAASRRRTAEAEEAWDGPVPELHDAPTADDAFLDAIVGGWSSRRGEEDVRIRASALSILGSAIEVNVAGLGSALVSSAIDVAVHILALEQAPEKAILRRAAIWCVLALVRALDRAREEGRKLGFGLVGSAAEEVGRVLAWVKDVDADGLVKAQAGEVLEEMDAWRLRGLIGMEQGGGELVQLGEVKGLERLAGLDVSPAKSSGRPKIEEVE